MDLRPDPFQVQLRRALRVGLAGVAVRPGLRGAPVLDGPASPASAALSDLSAMLYELPGRYGGLELGLAAGATVSEELGRAACGNPYRAYALVVDAALAADRPDVLDDVLAGATAASAGTETLTSRQPGVTAEPAGRGEDGGIELTGTATADAASADVLAVACRWNGSAALALVPAGSAGYKWLGDGWPHAVRLSGVVISRRDLVVPFGQSSKLMVRAQIRQAAYLLGLAAGMHEVTVRYTGTRRQFGSRLRDFQGVAFPLARAAITLRATRMLVYRAAWIADSGTDSPIGSMAPIEALAAAAETLVDIAGTCMQACGGHWMTSELAVHRYYRLAAAEPYRYGRPAELWRLVGAARLAEAAASPALVPLAGAARARS